MGPPGAQSAIFRSVRERSREPNNREISSVARLVITLVGFDSPRPTFSSASAAAAASASLIGRAALGLVPSDG